MMAMAILVGLPVRKPGRALGRTGAGPGASYPEGGAEAGPDILGTGAGDPASFVVSSFTVDVAAAAATEEWTMVVSV